MHVLVAGFTTNPPVQLEREEEVLAHCCPFQEYPKEQVIIPLKGEQIIPFQNVDELQSEGPLAEGVVC